MPCLEEEMFTEVEAHGRFSEFETFLYIEQVGRSVEGSHAAIAKLMRTRVLAFILLYYIPGIENS